jgi:RNA polymerase sigma factor (TIGR02999 family)
MNDVSTILTAIELGDQAAASKLLPLVYEELRTLAAQRLAREKRADSLQPTLLVHDAYLRLVGDDPLRQWNGKRHFFGAAAEAMRRLLVEHARRKLSQKHGGKMERVSLDYVQPQDNDDPLELLALDEALRRLEEKWPDKAQLVKLKYFAGLSVQESADMLGISKSAAERSWVFTRAWLHSRLDLDARQLRSEDP